MAISPALIAAVVPLASVFKGSAENISDGIGKGITSYYASIGKGAHEIMGAVADRIRGNSSPAP
jgi:hypothetical protein